MAYKHIYEQHDYERHPFVPIGMEALVHGKPHKHCTYVEHCTKVFVLSRPIEHYRCWQFWTPSTCATCISGAAFFQHKYLTNPTITVEDQVIEAIARLTDTLQGIRSPILFTSTLQALGNLHNVFHKRQIHLAHPSSGNYLPTTGHTASSTRPPTGSTSTRHYASPDSTPVDTSKGATHSTPEHTSKGVAHRISPALQNFSPHLPG